MQWDFKTIGEYARNWASIITLASAVVAITWFVYRLDERIRTLEAQVVAVTTASGGGDSSSSDPNAVAEALAEACAELMKRSASFHAKRLKTAEAAMEELIHKLRCGNGGGN